jgi:hypothetical protein
MFLITLVVVVVVPEDRSIYSYKILFGIYFLYIHYHWQYQTEKCHYLIPYLFLSDGPKATVRPMAQN